MTETEIEEFNKRQKEALKESERIKNIYNLQPNEYWFVVYECRFTIIQISPLGDCFFAFGQDMGWLFQNITEWIKKINTSELEKLSVK